MNDGAGDSRVLIVFSDDWGRHPSSSQHLITHLLDRHRVFWVNTIGMRPPRLDRYTLSRALGKLRGWRATGELAAPESLAILSPIMWPWFRSDLDRWLNRKLLVRALSRIPGAPSERVVVTSIPIVADVVDRTLASRWVYYCVDDFSAWPGLDHRVMDCMDRTLVAKVDDIIAVSPALQERLAAMGRDSALLTHGVDLDFWQSTGVGADGGEPVVLFWGVLDPRMDPEFLLELANRLDCGHIDLVGPQQDPPQKIASHPRIRVLGPRTFEALPALASRASALVMPYCDSPATRAIQPLKLKEYLATGRPVVVRDLPVTREWADCLDLAATPEAFADKVLERMQSGLPEPQRHARARLVTESWEAKAEVFEQIVLGSPR